MNRLKTNNKGQFSVIAALFVAVILISSVMVTYSTIRYNINVQQPQIMNAIDETNLALKQVLGFTVGYFGSILQVTGNSSYAYDQSERYLNSGLNNIVAINPSWSTSFNVTTLLLGTNWFTNSSYSEGSLNVTYDLPGLGVYGIAYSISSQLNVQVLKSSSQNQVFFTVTQDGDQPVVSLGKSNFKFYQYQDSNLTWGMINPPSDPIVSSDGTYTLDIPNGINPHSFIVQVQDQRGIMVSASSFSHYTGDLTFNSTTVNGGDYVNQYNSLVDGISDQGTHSNFTAQQQAPNGIYDALTEADVGTNGQSYHPSNYGLDGSTTLISGAPSNLVSDNGVYMTFGSYGSSSSGQTLYAHQSMTAISGTNYYSLLTSSATLSGVTLTASLAGSRTLLGKAVFSLQGLASIPASTWTTYYRASKTDVPLGITSDASSSGATGSSGSTSITWSHTTGSGSNTIMIVGVSIASSSIKSNSVTCGSQGLSLIRRDINPSGVTSELWYLLAPASGSHSITVNLSGNARAEAGACTYLNVVQSAPVAGDQAGNHGNSIAPSQSLTVSMSNSYLIGNLATSDSTTVTEGSNQAQLWNQQLGGNPKPVGHGSVKGPVNSGSQTISWSLGTQRLWAMSIVVLKPASTTYATGHIDADILVRETNGVVRQTIATGVAASGTLTNSYSTLSGTYSFSSYTIVSQTDYLEIDFYATPSAAGSSTANLMIDNNALATSDQTRATNVMLPSQYTCQAELTGPSNTNSWNNVLWAIDAASSLSNANAVFQLYNYNTGQYPSSGDGYLTATLGTSVTPNSQTITSNPAYYKDAVGNWKIRLTVTASSQFNINVDSCTFTSGVASYGLNLEEQWTNLNLTSLLHPTLCIYAGALGTNHLAVDAWTGTSWQTISSGLASGWNNVSINSYLTFGSTTFTMKFTETGDAAQKSWQVGATLIRPESNLDLFNSLENPSATVAVELLQNGTMIWLGQNLQITTQTIPIPPVPVKAIHVNETVNGVNQQVPFQIEDWASSYTVPLGLTNNATVFGNRQMVVFLVNTHVSDFTLWWDGHSDAVQTPLAYTDNYFINDNPSNGLLSNGKLSVQFGGGFTATSTVLDSGASSHTAFMKINGQSSDYGSGVDYVIYKGVVRDIVQQEAEWSNGVNNCPNFYADIVLTLPANATYFTYQLSLMFISSTQTRTISQLCPISVSSSVGSLQTENGTSQGDPVVASGTQLFDSTQTWIHHWSEFSDGNNGAGIMFTDTFNQGLYVFDGMAPPTPRGALSAASTISLLPVTLNSVSFQNPLDVAWYGAVVTFDSSVLPIYNGPQAGLWVLAEMPPSIAVTCGN